MKSSSSLLAAAALAALAVYSLHQQRLWAAEAADLSQRIASVQADEQAQKQALVSLRSGPGAASLPSFEQALDKARTSLSDAGRAHGLTLEQRAPSAASTPLPAGVQGQLVTVDFTFNSHQQLLAFVDDLTRAGQRIEQVVARQQRATVALLVAGESR